MGNTGRVVERNSKLLTFYSAGQQNGQHKAWNMIEKRGEEYIIDIGSMRKEFVLQ